MVQLHQIELAEKKGNIFDSNIGCEDFTQNPGHDLYPESDFDPEDCE